MIRPAGHREAYRFVRNEAFLPFHSSSCSCFVNMALPSIVRHGHDTREAFSGYEVTIGKSPVFIKITGKSPVLDNEPPENHPSLASLTGKSPDRDDPNAARESISRWWRAPYR